MFWRINVRMQYGVMGGRLGWEPDILDPSLGSNCCFAHDLGKLFSRKGSLRFPFSLQNHEEQIETRDPNIP